MKVIWTTKAQKALRNHEPKNRRQRLLQRIQGLENGLEGYDVARIKGRPGKVYRLRLDNIRVLIERRDDDCIVLDIVDRKDAY